MRTTPPANVSPTLISRPWFRRNATATTLLVRQGVVQAAQRGGAAKGFRRIFMRFKKLDAVFLGFLVFVLIVESLRALVLAHPNLVSF